MAVPINTAALLAEAIGGALRHRQARSDWLMQNRERLISDLLRSTMGEAARLGAEKQYASFKETLPSVKQRTEYESKLAKNVAAGTKLREFDLEQRRKLFPFTQEIAEYKRDIVKAQAEKEPELLQSIIDLRRKQAAAAGALAEYREWMKKLKDGAATGTVKLDDMLRYSTQALGAISRLYTPNAKGERPIDQMSDQMKAQATGLFQMTSNLVGNILGRVDPASQIRLVAEPLRLLSLPDSTPTPQEIVAKLIAIDPSIAANPALQQRMVQAIEMSAQRIKQQYGLRHDEDAYRALAQQLYYEIQSLGTLDNFRKWVQQAAGSQPQGSGGTAQ